MALSQRIESLKKKHSEIDEHLRTEEQRASKNEALISQLKKDKLTLKDEITKLEAEQEAAA